jgi:hypothetical protein
MPTPQPTATSIPYRGTEIPPGPNIMYAMKRTATVALPLSNIVCLSTTNGLDVADRFTNGRDLLRIPIGNFYAKFLPQREFQLDHSNRVSTQVFRKARSHCYVARRHAELRDNNFLDSIQDLFLFNAPPQPPPSSRPLTLTSSFSRKCAQLIYARTFRNLLNQLRDGATADPSPQAACQSSRRV